MSYMDYDNQEQFTDEQYAIWRKAIEELRKEFNDLYGPYYWPNPLPRDRQLDRIRNMSTRLLLNYLQRCRKVGGVWSDSYPYGGGLDIEDIKRELAKRPHIPKGPEAKRLRRQRAQSH